MSKLNQFDFVLWVCLSGLGYLIGHSTIEGVIGGLVIGTGVSLFVRLSYWL